MFRLYIVPKIGTGVRGDGFRPKYFGVGEALDGQASWSAMDYGLEDWMIVGADLTPVQDSFVAGQADVTAFPFDLSVSMTQQDVNTLKPKLESINIPAGWVTPSDIWIDVVRAVLGMFSFMQRFVALNGARLFVVGVTLNTAFGNLSQSVQDNFLATAHQFNLDTTGFQSNTTLRLILKSIADQLSAKRYDFNGTLL